MLKGLPNGARKVIANSPAILDFMVAAYGVRDDLIDDLRATGSIDDAEEFAKKENLGLGAVPGKTVEDVYAATGESALGGGGGKCVPPERWDPITQTCVPM